MRIVAYNVLIIGVAASPLLLLEGLRDRFKWVDDNHELLALAVWFVVLLLVYVYVLPTLGLRMNPRFFDQDH